MGLDTENVSRVHSAPALSPVSIKPETTNEGKTQKAGRAALFIFQVRSLG